MTLPLTELLVQCEQLALNKSYLILFVKFLKYYLNIPECHTLSLLLQPQQQQRPARMEDFATSVMRVHFMDY